MTEHAPDARSEPACEVVRADHRRVEGVRDPAALAAARQAIADLLDHEIRLGRLLLDLEERRTYVFEQAASVHDFARRAGLAPERTAVLLFLARALRHDPRFEPELRQGRLPMQGS
jgi:hypothetical protein